MEFSFFYVKKIILPDSNKLEFLKKQIEKTLYKKEGVSVLTHPLLLLYVT